MDRGHTYKEGTDKVIMDFLEENILSGFRCPDTIITDNVAVFMSANMIKFCENYGIKLRHSTDYYPKGNALEEYSNKSMVRIIKKLLEENKRAWDPKLKYALWVDRVSTKREIGTSLFQLVYGMEFVFYIQLTLPVVKYLHEIEAEPNDAIKRICQIVELHQAREKLLEKAHQHQQMIKETFDRK